MGLVGSIDNDFFGTDMTIGADTALERITDALDQIGSTASSHQRTFVVEVMGRNCGYLALMSSLAGTAHWVFIPESPPETDDWETLMCDVLAAGRAAGRRHSMVVIAEGARDRNGNPITSAQVARVLTERLGEDARVTILGHIQRGGAPSAFDRWMSTLVGRAAVEELLNTGPEAEPQLIGMRYNRITRMPLMECVQKTRAVADAIAAKDYERAMELRGGSFKDQFRILRTLIRALPHPPQPGRTPAAAGDPDGWGPGAGHEYGRAGGGAHGDRPGAFGDGGAQRLRRLDPQRDGRVWLDGRARLGLDGRLAVGGQPQGAVGTRPVCHRPHPGRCRKSKACW